VLVKKEKAEGKKFTPQETPGGKTHRNGITKRPRGGSPDAGRAIAGMPGKQDKTPSIGEGGKGGETTGKKSRFEWHSSGGRLRGRS